VLVPARKGCGHAPADDRRFCPHVPHRRAIDATSQDADVRPFEGLAHFVRREGHPHIVVHREGEPLGHHADDRDRRAPDPDVLAHDIGIGRESIGPDAVPHHGDRLSALRLILGRQHPPEHRRHAGEVESGRPHLRDGHRRPHAPGDQVL
jgi:hypothetical protein